jgi:cell surface protein SprA
VRNISLSLLFYCLLLLFPNTGFNTVGALPFQNIQSSDTTRKSPLKLDDVPSRPWENTSTSPFFLRMPSNYSRSAIYDPVRNEYVIYNRIGSIDSRIPLRLSPEEFRKYEYERAMRDYWQMRITGQEGAYRSSLIPQIEIGGETFDKVFGSNVINIIPQGSAELIFGVNVSHTENPALSERLRTIPTFDFQQKIQMNVTGSIGDKMQLGINYNTDAMFEFENRTKLEYSGKEDEIIKKIEAGDVTLPLPGTLITGSYSLFGLKTEMQFGKLTMTTVASQQKGESKVIDVKGGAQLQEFEIRADEYEANKHFFLSQYFRDIFDQSLTTLPLISSGINIERIEVWVTNKTSRFDVADNRNILAFMDLAENQTHIFNSVPSFQPLPGSLPFPDNATNNLYNSILNDYSDTRIIDRVTETLEPLYPSFQIGRDYEKIENARKLNEREFFVNRELGYVSLNIALNSDEVLAVAFEYTLGGKVYKVGEFSTDGISAPDALVLKLLKGTTLSPRLPTWKLMMKNIYSLGSGRIERKDFELNILYKDDATGNAINYLPEGNLSDKILLEVLGLDNLNSQLDREGDGVFDFIENVTVNSDRGRIIFPMLEPFGSHLASKITNPAIAARYVYRELYDSTQTVARQIAEKNKFILQGQYSSSSGSEIRLNVANIPQGGVKVTAGGVPLTENVDFTVDYFGGTVSIINSALIESQTPIQVSLESNQFFGFQTKTLVGTHLDYRVSKNFNIGGTVLHLNERPYTQKVTFGEEPISNTILGLNTSYRTDSRFLTKMIDKLPFIETKAPSSVNFFGEVARLYPGHSKAITSAGNSYIDDFEASEIPLDIKSFHAWVLASIPQGQNAAFPEARLNNDIASGFNRARLAWYVIDPLFLRNGSATPDHIKRNPDTQSSHFVREIFETEIFPFKESPSGIPTNIAVLNVAYYPQERGPYNFDTEAGAYSAGIDIDGLLSAPASRWGGIMREILTSDFEAANIQYIKFWLMDPFVEDPTHRGGDLFFNLGNISEDILRDSRKSFEHGLPGSPEVSNVDTTSWGRVPTIQAVVHAFDNSQEARRYQDVGLDGLSNNDENSFFADFIAKAGAIVRPEVLESLLKDPSADDFSYFRSSEYDRLQAGILERYKRYNGVEGNSPTSEMSQESYPTSGSTMPDMEDINRDNTLSETESYYQYRISMRPEDLQIGRNYVVDEIEYTATLANGTKSPVRWFQFKVPINEYERVVGPIRDFKSIRFIRMFMKDFDEDVILRFAKLDLVRSEWRKYSIAFMEGGERVTVPEPTDGTFDISSVSIEENAGKEPVNYVLPPGFDRVVDPQNPQLRQLNEQSMVLRVQELEDGDARAAYKTVNLDIRQYRRLRMEVHGEALIGQPLSDGELTAFIRIGSDYKGNFYEYEIPIKLTPPGRYSNDNDAQRSVVWPEENAFNIDLTIFQEAKQARNTMMQEEGSSLSLSDVFVYPVDGHRISVSGNPNLSNVRVIMVGIRNPIKTRGVGPDDGLPKSGEIWVNELRLSDFIEDGGWAANAHLQARLADLGSIDFVGQTSTPGWGSIDKKVNERSREEVLRYDASSNIELGRFFPEKAGVRLPVYLGYSESRIKPQYNPLDPDIPLEEAIKNAPSAEAKDSIRSIAEDLSKRKTLTISNAGITARGEKPQPWDLANLSVNYTYSEIFRSNIKTEIDLEKLYRGGISYNYDTSPKNYSPFSTMKLFNAPVFRIIKDINFYLFPRNISFRSDITRYYNEQKTRNISNPFLKISPTFRKDFEWTRYYDVKWDLTRQLKVDFTATNIARIDEPSGGVDKDRYAYNYSTWRDSVMQNIADFGRTVNYNHFINVNYNLPINKLPALNWITATVRFGSNYNWLAGPVFHDTLDIDVGNTIKNRSDMNFTSQANLATLYTRSEFLKKIENNTRPGGAKPNAGIETVNYSKDNNNFKAGQKRFIVHNLRTSDLTVKMIKEDGTDLNGRLEILSDSRIAFTSSEDAENVTINIEGRAIRKRSPLIVGGEYLVRAMMGVRNISFTYRSEEGQILPGYMPASEYFGSTRYNNVMAPGFGFVTGFNDVDFFDRAAINGWLTTDTLLNIPAVSTSAATLTLRATLEPFPGMRIDVNADRKFAQSFSSYYRADRFGNFPDSTRNTVFSGNFTISVISWGTAFEKITKENEYVSPTFESFKTNTMVISRRMAEQRSGYDPMYNPDIDPNTGIPLTDGYKSGYGIASREVLIPAFLAAYTKGDPERVTLDPFPSPMHMMPNWRITFDGLSRFEIVQRVFRSVNLTHQYRSTYTIGSYTTNLSFSEEGDGVSRIRDLQSNFIPPFDINIVTISEQFSPLLNLDMNWKNSLTTRMEWKKSRTVSLNLTSNQVADIRNDEWIIGVGYRFSDVQIVVRTGGVQRPLKSDLTVRLDLSLRDNKTMARKLIESVNQPVAGQKIFRIGTTADYVLSDRFNLQFFADHSRNNPFVANTFPISNTNVGFSLKFTLVQ